MKPGRKLKGDSVFEAEYPCGHREGRDAIFFADQSIYLKALFYAFIDHEHDSW